MTDWAAEAVTRGDIYMLVVVISLHAWNLSRAIARLEK